ncbi:SsuE family FMN reductase [Paenibacillus cellulosilyticus]|uniref:SsuE family FMN reductase n=1 Tax=Paenibacillus cellulosilyticus TaxID=375489 RepID=A0A2V2YRU6_9BACL|nr:NADPH-dependent FMN reductase [Paenibacillus cellulosilyticus]PWV97962.1 SsuE family FMN reductase [Paenibacillus cellulosilyticus]QKS44007.1 NADPH-dependent FMN reductase [Paenibacillus cellulosilyticus]
MANIVSIIATPNQSSRLLGVTNYVEQQLREQGYELTTLQVTSIPAEDLIFARFDSPEVAKANALVEAADAVIIASPVYKASYSGILKTYLDLLPQKGLDNKIVAPIFIGGTIAHLLSIDYSLKPVLASLGARHYTSSIYATDSQVTRTGQGDDIAFALNDELKERLDKTIQELRVDLARRSL